jgi:hypothetical protein
LLFISMFPWAIPDKTSDFPIRWCIVIICLSHCLYYFQYHYLHKIVCIILIYMSVYGYKWKKKPSGFCLGVNKINEI